MKILLVHTDDISRFPPVRNLLECLLDYNHEVTIVTKDKSKVLEKWKNDKLKVHILEDYKSSMLLNKGVTYLRNRRKLRKTIPNIAKTCDLVWTTTDITVREMGKQLLSYRHVMQLMELAERLPQNAYIKRDFDIKYFAQKAYKVVVPELNRAYITKAWWNLDEMPVVLPNKPYSLGIPEIPEALEPYLSKMKAEKRKIVLYQGVFYKDRDLEPVAEAIDILKDKYCLYIMGRDTDIRRDLCKKHPSIQYIPFFEPPYHLLVTRNADIGLLPYKPANHYHFSILNALYCAPNKIYEYSAYGLPMIGSDVPGLAIPFSLHGMGVCYKKETVDEIVEILETIDRNYEEMSKSAISFYDSTNYKEIVNDIIESK